MSGLDDRLDDAVRRLAAGVDGPGAYAAVARRKRRRQVVRRIQTAVLAIAIVATSAGAVVALTRAFTPGTGPADRPVVGPTPTSSPTAAANCPEAHDDLPPTYRPMGRAVEADVAGGGPLKVRIWGEEERPPACRYFLVATGENGPTYRAAIRPVEWIPVPPSILLAAEIDGQPGTEVVVEFGGPGHPHRTGEVFTLEPGPSRLAGGSLGAMTLVPGVGGPKTHVPLYGEFPAGVDCTGVGVIIVTLGSLAEGGADDSRYEITRFTYQAEDGLFIRTGEETTTVPVGTEVERWPELADDSFRSCPRA